MSAPREVAVYACRHGHEQTHSGRCLLCGLLTRWWLQRQAYGRPELAAGVAECDRMLAAIDAQLAGLGATPGPR